MKTTTKTRTSKAPSGGWGLLILLITSTLTFAQNVIRVQNGQNIQNVIDSPNTPAGSILILDPGTYAGFKILKKVVIVGSGYFNGNNVSRINGSVYFEGQGALPNNSMIIGCSASSIDIWADDITVLRCQTTGISINNNNATVKQCFVENEIYIGVGHSDFTIQNNIIFRGIRFGVLTASNTGKIINNTVGVAGACKPLDYGQFPIVNLTIRNNIFVSPENCGNLSSNTNYATAHFGKFNNNIVRTGNYQSVDASNKFLTDMTTLFTDLGITPDAKYTLSANSPAKGAGEGGTDCGAFGGPDPYVLTGSPIGPIIQDIQVPSTARQNETIQVKLKARVQN